MNRLLSGILLLIGGLFSLPKNAPVSFPAQKQEVDRGTLDTFARTIWGEARGEGYKGMQAVANVIMNRYRAAQGSAAKARQFGGTIAEICQKPYQFSAWNYNDPNLPRMLAVTESNMEFRAAKTIALAAMQGRLLDITGGADHYHTNAVKPEWSRGMLAVARIGVHEFYRIA